MKITGVETVVVQLPNRWAHGWHGMIDKYFPPIRRASRARKPME